MKEYNKQFEYNGMKFNMSITLNHTVEKSLDGKTYHLIVTNCLGYDQYYAKTFVDAKTLKEVIEGEELKVRAYVDKKYKAVVSDEEQVLIDLGFK